MLSVLNLWKTRCALIIEQTVTVTWSLNMCLLTSEGGDSWIKIRALLGTSQICDLRDPHELKETLQDCPE